MGYTNYWSQPTDFTDKEWTLVQKEFDYIREIVWKPVHNNSFEIVITTPSPKNLSNPHYKNYKPTSQNPSLYLNRE